MVHFTHMFFTERMQVDSGNLLFFIYPFIGILLTTLFVKFFVKEGNQPWCDKGIVCYFPP